MPEQNYQEGVEKVYQEIQKGNRDLKKLILENVPGADREFGLIRVGHDLVRLHDEYRRE